VVCKTLSDEAGQPTVAKNTELWTVFDELREWNAQAARLTTLSSLALAAMGVLDLKQVLETNLAAVAKHLPALAAEGVVLTSGGVAVVAVVASIVLSYTALADACLQTERRCNKLSMQ
jgi:hypothetical protein